MFPTLLSRKFLATSMSMWNIDGSGLGCSNSIINALDLLQSCTKQSIWPVQWHVKSRHGATERFVLATHVK